MENRTTPVTTQELWAKLFLSPSVEEYLAENGDACSLPTFSEYITALANLKGEKPVQIIKRGDIEASYGHRLFTGARTPSRDTVLQMAFGLELGTDETQQLLKVAHASPLHPKVKRDAVIAFCLHRHYSLAEAQAALFENGLPVLGGASRGKR